MDLSHNLHQSERINSANNPVWMDALRIALGVFLFFKGVMFLQHTSDMFYIFSNRQELIEAGKASTFTSIVHIVGGLMIAFGFLTRLSLLLQIPIVLSAALLVNPQQGFGISNTELWLSIVILGLLVFFMIVGPGRYSVDNKVLRKQSHYNDDDEVSM
ncbi:DoxX family protein [Pontibacter silvestris]|uniref:DoxX family protein n=1 Tax=Pontibacter silvestris TaxID=2305183 RepID=A0ABW4WY19_9BACT|nr:DoxX family protein [Pontibacter silvestris]MCC9135229.1 DoxX family protein [Pontibacter silvestris]